MGQTSEDAVNQIGNRYEMVLIASLRARELRRGHQAKIAKGSNGKLVTALKEIEQGLIGRDYLKRIR